MFGLALALAAFAQAPEYVAGYAPKVGDKVVLARDEPGRRVPIAKDDGAALGFKDVIEESDSNYEAILEGNDLLVEVAGGTPAQVVEGVSYLKDPIIFKVRILEGPSKGKTAYAYTKFCRKPDPAFAKAAAEARKGRGPLDKKAIAAEVGEAIAGAKPNEPGKDLEGKKKLVREAVKPVCEKHKADFREVNDLAAQAGVFATLDGKKYDVAGNRVRN